MRRLLFAAVLFACLPRPASAQAITQWTLRTYNAGAALPLQTTVIPVANAVCNQTMPVVTPYTQPTRAAWDDPVNVGKACIWTDTGTGPLFSVPFGGTYEASLTATSSAGTSAESIRAPFTRPGSLPALPSGLRIGG